MFQKSFFSICAALLLLVSFGCGTNSFLPVHDYGNVNQDGTTLGQRTISDPHAFAPGTQRSWLEVCQRKVVKQKNGAFKWTETTYVEPCEPTTLAGNNFVTFSPYVTGIATPIIQAGAIVGGAALLADGIRDSASRTTNNTSSNGGSQSQGQGQLQGQGQHQGQSSSNFNSNINSNRAEGGNGFGGAGGAGGSGGKACNGFGSC